MMKDITNILLLREKYLKYTWLCVSKILAMIQPCVLYTFSSWWVAVYFFKITKKCDINEMVFLKSWLVLSHWHDSISCSCFFPFRRYHFEPKVHLFGFDKRFSDKIFNNGKNSEWENANYLWYTTSHISYFKTMWLGKPILYLLYF